MAERNIAVRLSARVDQYIAAMEAAKASTASLSTASQANLTKLGGQMQTLGRNATRYVTVPLLALGAGSVLMASNFETAFAQMVGLANVPADEVDNLKESVLALAGETAVAPQELAEGLYFAASAGLDASEAMEVLEVAAKASASGMGTTADVVNLVTSAIAAYGADNITAAEATDVLTAAIREGKAEPTEMAGALGRVTPIAAQMGISFAEVAGATAFMSTVLGDTDETVTALRGALLAMMDPSAQGKKALESMGISAEELQAAIAQDGLLGALDLLREHGFNENSVAMSDLFEDNRALVGATILLNDETGRLAETIGTTTASAGSLGDAWSAVSETDAQKLKQALTDIKVAMIQAGIVLLPLVASIASAIGDLASWFADLDPAVQAVVLGLGGLAAVIGPVVFIVGAFIKNLVAIKGAMTALAASSITPWLLGIAAAATVAFVAYKVFGGGQSELEKRTLEVGEALVLVQDDVFRYALEAEGAEGSVAGLAAAQAALSQALLTGEDGEKLTQSLGILGRQTTETAEILLDIGQNGVTALYRLAVGAGVAASEAEILARIVADSDDEFDIASAILDQLGEEYLDIGMAMEEMQDQAEKTDLSQVAQEGLAAAAASSEQADQMIRYIEAATGMSRTGEDAVTVYQMYGEALGMADQATQDLILASDESGASIDAMAESGEGAAGSFSNLSEKTVYSADSLKEMTEAAFNLTEKTVYLADSLKAMSGPLIAAVKGSDEFTDAVGEMADVSSDATDSFRDLQDAGNDLMAAFEQMLSPADNLRETAMAVHSTFNDVVVGLEETAKAGIETAEAFDITTEAGRTNMENFEAARDAIYAHGAAMVADGASAEEAARDIAYNTESLVANLRQADVSEEAILRLIAAYQLTPSDVATAIAIYGEAEANRVIDRYNSQLGSIPLERASLIKAAIQAGDLDEANRLLDLITSKTRTAYIGVKGPGASVASTYTTKSAALGSYVATAGIWQLHANEAVMPLDDPPRMRALAADPRIGEPLMAALSGVMTPGPSAMASFSSSSTVERSDLPPIYVYNNGRDITSHDIARAIAESRAA